MFDKEDLKDLLEQLNKKMSKLGLSANIYIVGGGAMALAYGLDRLTEDIDVSIKSNDKFDEIVAEIARENNIDEHWLNNDVEGPMKLLKDIPEGTSILDTENLHVEVAPADFIFAMKAIVGRAKDIEDMLKLNEILKLSNRLEVFETVKKYYGDDFFAKVDSGKISWLNPYQNIDNFCKSAILVGQFEHSSELSTLWRRIKQLLSKF
jgi:hypothetical protein